MQFISFNYNDRFDIFIVAIDFIFLYKILIFFFIETVFFSILFRNLERIYKFFLFCFFSCFFYIFTSIKYRNNTHSNY